MCCDRRGNRIVYYGTTNDLERREQEHRNDGMSFTSMEKVGRITTSAAAGAWEEGEIKRYKQSNMAVNVQSTT